MSSNPALIYLSIRQLPQLKSATLAQTIAKLAKLITAMQSAAIILSEQQCNIIMLRQTYCSVPEQVMLFSWHRHTHAYKTYKNNTKQDIQQKS
jgi:hypothetical protein